jgi:hypothetical protein
MATIKNIPDQYTINVPLMTVNGNLVVLGNTTVIESQALNVYDSVITMNSNVTGAPVQNATIQVDRGTSANTAIRWSESLQSWQLTNNGTTFSNIAVVGGTPLNGNLNITSSTLYDTVHNVTMFTGTPNSGKSGVYVNNANGTNFELSTRTAAIAFSIIFG